MRPRRLVPAALAAALSLSGCSLLTGSEDANGVHLDALRAARARWEASGTVNYSFRLQLHLGMIAPPPVEITVINGQVFRVEDLETGEPSATPALYGSWDTVDELLTQVEDALQEGPADFEGRYNASLGYPAVVAVDPVQNAIDEEWGFTVVDLEPVPGPQ